MYELIYDYSGEYTDEHNIRETFEGTWDELRAYIKEMKNNGCYNINAACVSECFSDDYEYDWEEW